MNRQRTASGAALFVLCAALLGCGDSPSNPSGGNPTPAPTPTPTPTPTPAPTPTPKAVCQLTAMDDCGAGCCREGGDRGRFRDVIEGAQATLRETRPELFKSNGRIDVSEQEYTDALADQIVQNTKATVCSVGAGGSTSKDEIRVKSDNDLAQHVDVIISDGTPWVGDVYTCRPASF